MTDQNFDFQKFPGIVVHENTDKWSHCQECVRRRGYYIFENVFDSDWLVQAREKLDSCWEKQKEKYGAEFLEKINDYGQIRGIMKEDEFFLNLLIHPTIDRVVSDLVSPTAILHLQNGIVVMPERKHNQGKYHRDFPKDFVSTKLLSVNTFVVVDEFTAETGGTWFVPGSHLFEDMPSREYIEENQIQLSARSGTLLVFDSLLWHRGGVNNSGRIRRAINMQFTRPFIKQQIDYPEFLKGCIDKESKIAQRLGMWAVPPKSVDEFRVTNPALRTYRAGQG